MHQALMIMMETSSNGNKFWWNQVMMKVSFDGHVTLTSFVFFWRNVAFKFWSHCVVFFLPRAETNKAFQRQIECNESFVKKQKIPLVLFNRIIH
jgi:hypothetical protein